MLAIPSVTASKNTLNELKSAISSFDDPHMDADDLAFYLATHDFDAKPKGSYVEVELGEKICKLIPNGSAPGLCTIAA
jgi:hypothetical protein